MLKSLPSCYIHELASLCGWQKQSTSGCAALMPTATTQPACLDAWLVPNCFRHAPGANTLSCKPPSCSSTMQCRIRSWPALLSCHSTADLVVSGVYHRSCRFASTLVMCDRGETGGAVESCRKMLLIYHSLMLVSFLNGCFWWLKVRSNILW
jgi:hypothetical protein